MINFEQFGEFLKKYSTIPNSFIDDFFTFYSYNTTDDDIIINYELVAKWLDVRNNDLKKTIVRSYIENVDYKITIDRKSVGSKGGRPKEQILLSTSCFRRICMNSNTERGKEVRKYYEKIEKLLHKYKDHIIESLQKRIDILEHNQKPKIEQKKGVIYFLKSQLEADNIFKLGKSKKFKKRLISHNSSHSDDVEVALIFETDNIDEVEGCMKAILKKKQYRKRKEIYQVDLDVLKNIMESCSEIMERLDVKQKKKTLSKISRIKKTKTNINTNYFLFIHKIEPNVKPENQYKSESIDSVDNNIVDV
jgi:phage anti-repressor protein